MLAMSARGLVNSWALKQRQCIYILRVYYRAAVDKVISLQMLHLHQRSIPSKTISCTINREILTSAYLPAPTTVFWLVREPCRTAKRGEARVSRNTNEIGWICHVNTGLPIAQDLSIPVLLLSMVRKPHHQPFHAQTGEKHKGSFFAYMGLLYQYLFQWLLYYLKKCAEKMKAS